MTPLDLPARRPRLEPSAHLRLVALLTVALLAFLVPAAAQAQMVTFTKIFADTTVPDPVPTVGSQTTTTLTVTITNGRGRFPSAGAAMARWAISTRASARR